MTQYNRIKQHPATLGNTKKTIRPRANQSKPMFFEKDLQLPGIVKETNNYPPLSDCEDYDLDACLFIQLANITNKTQKQAINTLVLSAKENEWWNLCRAIYPVVGGTELACSLNLKDPYNFNLIFVNITGDPIFSDTGIQFGNLSFARTGIIPSVDLTQDSSHISYYSRNSSDGINGPYDCVMGVNNDVSNFNISLGMYLRYTNGRVIADHYSYPTSRISVTNPDATGFYLSSRINISNFSLYKNNSLLFSNSGTPGIIPSKELFLGALNDGGSIVSWSTYKECGFATVGYGINSTVALLMYNDVQSFQTTLGRQI